MIFAINIETLTNLKYYIFLQALDLSIVYSKCSHKYKNIFKEEEPIELLKMFGLVTNLEKYQKHIIMSEENVSQEFRLKNMDKTGNYLIEIINESELIGKKHKKLCRVLNYIEH